MKKYLCYDKWTGRLLKSTEDKLVLAVAEINSIIRKDEYATLNDFYDLIGLAPVLSGTDLGWTEEFGLRPDSMLLDGGIPVYAFGFSPYPKVLPAAMPLPPLEERVQ